MGRPSKYQPEFPGRLRQSMAEGLSFEASCGELGINKDTGYFYVEKHEEFRDAKLDGQTLNQLFWERVAIANLVTGAEHRFNATVWIFAMKNMHGWRDKRELTGAGGAPLLGDITGVQVDDRIAAILARLPPELGAMVGKRPPTDPVKSNQDKRAGTVTRNKVAPKGGK